MNIHKCISSFKCAIFGESEESDEVDLCCSDSRLLCFVKKLIDEEVINLMLNNDKIIGKKFDLSDVSVSFDEYDNSTINLDLPNNVRDNLRKFLNKEKLSFTIRL